MGVSICLLLMDGRMLLFIVTMIMLISICIGLSIYRRRKMSKREDEHARLVELEKLGIAMDHESSIEGLMQRAAYMGVGDQLIDMLRKESSDEVNLPQSCSDYFYKMVNAFKENDKETIYCIQKEIVKKRYGFERNLEECKSKRSLGLLMAFLICLPLAFLPRVTIVSNAMVRYDWLDLLLRIMSVLTFVFVEFVGSSEKGFFKKGRAI